MHSSSYQKANLVLFPSYPTLGRCFLRQSLLAALAFSVSYPLYSPRPVWPDVKGTEYWTKSYSTRFPTKMLPAKKSMVLRLNHLINTWEDWPKSRKYEIKTPDPEKVWTTNMFPKVCPKTPLITMGLSYQCDMLFAYAKKVFVSRRIPSKATYKTKWKKGERGFAEIEVSQVALLRKIGIDEEPHFCRSSSLRKKRE